MSTGITSWAGNLTEIGPMYPFVGSEFALTIIALVLWVVWHISQIKHENDEIAHISKLTKDKKVQARYISRTNSKKR